MNANPEYWRTQTQTFELIEHSSPTERVTIFLLLALDARKRDV